MRTARRSLLAGASLAISMAWNVLGAEGPAPAPQACSALLEFDAGGRLVSDPPDRLPEKGEICVRVQKNRASRESFAEGLLESYLETVRAAERLKSAKDPAAAGSRKVSELRFGMSVEDLVDVKAGVCTRALQVLKKRAAEIEGRAFFEGEFRRLGCVPGLEPDADKVVPAASEPGWSVVVRGTTSTGAETIANPKTVDLNDRGTFLEGQLSIGDLKCVGPCGQVLYELRRKSAVAARVAGWWTRNTAPGAESDAIKDAARSLEGPAATAEKYAPLASAVSERLKDPTKPKPDVGKAKEAIDAARDAAFKTFVKLSGESATGHWLTPWFWLTRGTTFDPLGFGAASPALANDARKLAAQIAELDAEIAAFELMAKSQDFKFDQIHDVVQYLPAIADRRVRRDQLAKELEAKKALLAAAEQASTVDDFRYSGLLLGGARPPVMAHHDATNQYLLMSAKPVREIEEGQRFVVMVENEQPESQLRLDAVGTVITSDPSPITRELVETKADEKRAADEKELRSFLDSYVELADLVAFLEARLVVPQATFREVADQTPALVTRVVPHDVHVEAPATIAYTIKKKAGSEEKDAGKGEYRINKLYSARFKAGLVYSFLNKSGSEKADYGVDGTFGIQVYVPKADIRSPGVHCGFYAGFSMRQPLDNAFLAFAAETFRGVSFLGGLHVGKLTREAGDPKKADIWKGGPFVSIAFDPELLRTLFGLKMSL